MVPNPLAVWKQEHNVEGEDTRAEWLMLNIINELRQVILDHWPESQAKIILDKTELLDPSRG